MRRSWLIVDLSRKGLGSAPGALTYAITMTTTTQPRAPSAQMNMGKKAPMRIGALWIQGGVQWQGCACDGPRKEDSTCEPSRSLIMKRLSVNVPPELHREAKLLAHLEDETLSSLVLKLLRNHVHSSQAQFSDMRGLYRARVSGM